MRFLLFTFVTFLLNHAYCQIILQSHGEIPAEIFQSSSEKFALKRDLIVDSSYFEPRDVRLARLKNSEQATYLIDAIKNSGDIYINDDYTKLINGIADELLRDLPEIRTKIHLYAYKAPYVNAFSTDQGDIFFTVGLLAYLDNEAELAFVVGHEIVHYIKQHNEKGFSERIKIARGKDQYTDLTVDRSWEAEHLFSQSLEKEADIQALDLYLKTTYDTAAIFTGLSKLKTADLGYKDTAIEEYIYNLADFVLPEGFLPDSLKIKRNTKRTEKYSTHPEVEMRLAYCKDSIAGRNSLGSDVFKNINASNFEKLKYLARKEQLLMLFDNHYYAKGIYNAYLMRLRDPGNKEWYDQYISLAMVTVSELRIINYDTPEKSAEYSGSLFNVWYTLYKGQNLNTILLTSIHSFNTFKESSTDYNKGMVIRSLDLLVSSESKTWKQSVKNQFDSAKTRNTVTKELLPMLKGITETELFTREFNQYLQKNSDEKIANEDTTAQSFSLTDLKNIVIYNPYYVRIDERAQGYIDYSVTYANEQNLLQNLDDILVRKSLEYSILDVRNLKSDDGDKFDDISTLGNYIRRFDIRKFKNNEEILTPSQDKLDSIRAKYQTDYVMWIGARSYKGTSLGFNRSLLLSLFVPNYLPFGVLKLFLKDHEYQLFYIVFDLKNNTIVKKKALECYESLDNRNLTTIYLNKLLED